MAGRGLAAQALEHEPPLRLAHGGRDAGYAENRQPIEIAVGAANCMTRSPVSSSIIALRRRAR